MFSLNYLTYNYYCFNYLFYSLYIYYIIVIYYFYLIIYKTPECRAACFGPAGGRGFQF